MKKVIIAVIVVVALAGVAMYSGLFKKESAQAAGQNAAGTAGRQGAGGAAGRGGGGAGRGGFAAGRQPMTVELASTHKAIIAEQVTVVGNLIGEATVAVAPRTAGRLQNVFVKLGDRVTRGQRLATIEDFEIREQVKQAEAAMEVSLATIRQREADLKRSETNVQRSRSLFERQLLPRQTLDDNEATYQASLAQLDLARAQNNQAKARLDELKINLNNTVITSPVTGFVSRRAVDPGAFVGQNAPIVDVVDISTVRLVANVIEKDLRRLRTGDAARTQVDAFPGEEFVGRIARISPVLDPATRTAPIEIEIPNPAARLKPGMYARVGITVNAKKEAIVVPVTALVDLGGRRGVFVPLPDSTAAFRIIQVGVETADVAEVISGLAEGDRVITTGAAALRDGDRIILPGRGQGGRGRRGEDNSTSAAPAGGRQGAAASATQGTSQGALQFRGGGDGQAATPDAAGQTRRGGFRRGGQGTQAPVTQ
jgi:membrane fusion protein, multidrug efflux system